MSDPGGQRALLSSLLLQPLLYSIVSRMQKSVKPNLCRVMMMILWLLGTSHIYNRSDSP